MSKENNCFILIAQVMNKFNFLNSQKNNEKKIYFIKKLKKADDAVKKIASAL